MSDERASGLPDKVPGARLSASRPAGRRPRLLVDATAWPAMLVFAIVAGGVNILLGYWISGERQADLFELAFSMLFGVGFGITVCGVGRHILLTQSRPPAVAALVPADRVRLRQARRGAELELLVTTLLLVLLSGGLLAIAVPDTWQLVRAAGIAQGGVTTTGTVVGVVDGSRPGYRVAFAATGGTVEAVVVPRQDPVLDQGRQVSVVYDPASPQRAALPEDARWLGPWPWLGWGGALCFAGLSAWTLIVDGRALRGAARARLAVATVATVLGVGSGKSWDLASHVLLLRFPPSGQRPERWLAFPQRGWRPSRHLVHGDQVVVFGDVAAGMYVVAQTADGQVLLPYGPLRLPD